jgi:cysteine synthase A
MTVTLSSDVLAAIGGTPLVQLRRLPPPGSARLLLKLESANPTGSMKDRMARSMIEAAESDGRLAPGGAIVELTGGSTGTSLALVCAVKRYPLFVVTSDAISLEKRNHMKALGATVTVVASHGGGLTRELFESMLAETHRLQEARGAFWTNQFENHAQADGYAALGEEIWEQAGGQLDAFVQVVGTCGSLRGTSTALRRHQAKLHVVAVEPSTSPVLSGGRPGSHRIEGVGIGRLPPMWDPQLADDIEHVSTEDAEAMARRLACEEGIFAGTSSGANVVAALRVAERLGPAATVVSIVVDTGLKYLSTHLYR